MILPEKSELKRTNIQILDYNLQFNILKIGFRHAVHIETFKHE